VIDIDAPYQWRSRTDLKQVHRLPFTRRHRATVLPTWFKWVGERSPAIAYHSASVPERH
jgi:hypothetical protein